MENEHFIYLKAHIYSGRYTWYLSMRRTKRNTETVRLIYADLTAIGDAPIRVCVCCKSFKRAQQIILLLPLIYKQQRMTVLETLSSMFTCSVLILDRDSCDGNFMESLLAWVRTKWKLVAARARKTKWTFIKINHHRCDGGTHATQSNTEMSAETVRQLEIIATRIHTHQFAVCAKWN